MSDPRQEIRRRPSAADRLRPAAHEAEATSTTFARPHGALSRPQGAKTPSTAGTTARPPPTSTETRDAQSQSTDGAAAKPSPTSTEAQDTRTPSADGTAAKPPPTSTEADSTASRSANRLSLTLPIAPPVGDRPRAAPTAAASFSLPPTPLETPTIPPPTDANDFIIAIAAQERRVLELREELGRAEADLTALKKQWTSTESFFMPGTAQQAELHTNAATGAPDEVAGGPRRSLDLDRRKLWLQSQSQSQGHGTPTQGNRRRFFRGGHTRTLSLLSPARPNSDFLIHETRAVGPPDATPKPALLKRASWQPRSVQNSPSVGQIVEDFRLGLKTIVDDIRQITVGDEPIGGPSFTPGPLALQRSGPPGRGQGLGSSRPRTGFAPTSPHPNMGTPTPASRTAAPTLDKSTNAKSKRFSWTPLELDAVDDNDWSNWESPAPPTKSPRWSDSTINSAGLEEIGSIAEALEESMTPDKAQATKNGPLRLPSTLDEIIPNAVKQLSQGGYTQTANSLMGEWKKSLMSPELEDKENQALKT